MAIESQVSKVFYAGDGLTTAFSVPFYFFAAADIVVVLREEDGTENIKTLTSDYTVSGAGNEAGGTVTMVTPPDVGATLVIYREPAILQGTRYPENDSFPASSHERALDRLTMIAQRQQEQVLRAMRIKETTDATAFDLSLPDPSPSRAIVWNETGDGLANSEFDPDASAAAAQASADAAATSASQAAAARTQAQAARDQSVAARDEAEAFAASIDPDSLLKVANNLSDLDDAATARDNLGLGTAAVLDAGAGPSNVPQNSMLGDAAYLDISTDVQARDGVDNTTVITPVRLRDGLNASGNAPVYACRAWCNFDGTTTPPTIRANGNVSSVSRVSTGVYDVVLINAMPDANFSVSGSASAANQPLPITIDSAVALTTTSFRFFLRDASSNLANSPLITFQIVR